MESAMLKLTIVSDALRRQPYINKKGQPAELYFQTAYLHTIEPSGEPSFAPGKFEFIAERGDDNQPKAVARGQYELHPSAIQINRDGRLEVTPTRLTPVKRPA
jgi:hypothetical protein